MIRVEIDYEELARRVSEFQPPQDGWPVWMDIETVERYTSIPRHTLYKSQMPYEKPDGRRLYHRPAVDAYIRGQR